MPSEDTAWMVTAPAVAGKEAQSRIDGRFGADTLMPTSQKNVGRRGSDIGSSISSYLGRESMKKLRGVQKLRMLAAGAILLQAGGCDYGAIIEIVQTVLLGVTAAGSVAIIQNI